MAVLFSGAVPIPAGNFESAAITVPGNLKRLGEPLRLRVSMQAEPFPDGITTISVSLSFDNRSTWKTASMTVVMPHAFKGPPPHFWTLEFARGPNEMLTDAKYATTAPAAFVTSVTVEAL